MSENPTEINTEDRDASVSVSEDQNPGDLEPQAAKDKNDVQEDEPICPEANKTEQPADNQPQPQQPNSESEKSVEPISQSEKTIEEDEEEEEEEEPEVGIVGPARTAGDILNDEELVDPPAKSPKDTQVAEWVEKTKIQNEKSKSCGKNGTKESSVAVPSRKSQRALVSNIIKRSIKCLKMPQCAVATCRNSHRRTRGRRIRYHRFPQIPEVRARWVSACGRQPLSNGDVPFNIQTARICSLHFTNESYEKDMEHLVLGLPVRSRLRRGAVPTIGVPVEVQPLTRRLVDEAKRSLLKIKYNQNNKKTNETGTDGLRSNCNNDNEDGNKDGDNGQMSSGEQKMAGIDILLALGLKPALSLNKMHAMDCATPSPSTVKADKRDDDKRALSKVPQSRQNGAALPEETATTAAAASATSVIKRENQSDDEEIASDLRKKVKSKERKRRTTEEAFANGNPKRICFEQRERFIDSLVGCDRVSAEELANRADELRAEVQALDQLARAKEMEWNEILSMRKLKEEAYLRVERKRQVMGFLENTNGQLSETIPAASMCLTADWGNQNSNLTAQQPQETLSVAVPREDVAASGSLVKKDPETAAKPQNRQPTKTDQKRQKRILDAQLDARQIGEGRQGPIVDVRSIIADYRLRHPETVPRRGRRMRNSVNIGLAAGGGLIETHDSRPSSTDSCKSGTNVDNMSFKDVLVQFAKLSQQQGEPVKTPQNYPDVTLHPVAPGPANVPTSIGTSSQTGSLLHGILTKNQSPRPTTFSPTLARLLTAPERERSQAQGAQIVQGFQGNSQVSISDLLSSSKARTEITITPVVNTPMQSSHTNNVVTVDEDEDNSLVEERETRRAQSRDNREDRDNPPRCQGCHERAAQFVCAGCGNQWYCSRECQVSAWDLHSEVCSG